jgi:ATP-dependent RNA helicase DeaD
METFENLLGKENPLLLAVKDRGFSTPSEIQEKTIPTILEGKDVIAGAATGSGKTLAFAAGLIKNIEKGKGIQGLVLTPTRELAEQITAQLLDFSKYKELNVIAVYGGVSISNQIVKIPHCEIIVATPGRVLDHLQRHSLSLGSINTLVLDEADRMLDMGFRDDVEKIITQCSKKRQTMLFSATISYDIVELAQRYMNHPVEIAAAAQVDPSKLLQVYYDVPDGIKYSLLVYLLKNENAKLVMIFCNTRRNVDFVAENLNRLGIEATPIHGGYSQDKRTKIMDSFHSEKFQVLVATDVAARGLDIEGVSHIYNYDIPPTLKEYTHRIGRTARAGKDGKVINILASRDYENFQEIANSEFKLKQEELPYIQRVMISFDSNQRREGYNQNRSYRRNGPRRDFGRSRSAGPRRNYGREDRSSNEGHGRGSGGDRYGDRDGRPRRRNFGNNSNRTYR